MSSPAASSSRRTHATPPSICRRRFRSHLARTLVALSAATAACTYGPPEERATVEQIVRLGDSFDAIIVVRHDRFRRPTGLSTFPDGGKSRFLAQGATFYRVDAAGRTVTPLAERSSLDSLWESFHAGIGGLQDDTVAYVALSGCRKGGQCYGDLVRTELLRVSVHGDIEAVRRIPAGTALPGESLARMVGERNYVRFSVKQDTVTARFRDGGPYEPVFLLRSDGVLLPIPRGS